MCRYHARTKGLAAPTIKGWPFPISLILLVVAPLLWELLAGRPVAAQWGGVAWSSPVNLSNSPQSSGRPAIVADGYGYVHVFWSEEVGGESILDVPEQLIHDGNTIFYTRWDGVSWTQPIDILFVPGEAIAEYVAVTVDRHNRLHAVWTGYSNTYYSSAPSWQAGSAHSWREPALVASDNARTPWAHDIVTDADDNVHIVYATRGDGVGVYHTVSPDGGVSWRPPVMLSAPFAELETSYSNVKVIVDGAGRLHVVWQTNQAEGYGQAAYYARSIDGGSTWATPVQMGYREPGEYDVSFPYVTSVGESELHLIYIDGPWHIGRHHRISQDGGATWSRSQRILTDLEGVNGYTIPLLDGDGGLHLVTTMRTVTQIGGPFFYTRWLGTSWSPAELPFLGGEQTGPGAHWTAATVRLGDEIHVVWNTNFTRKAGEIWHSRGKIAWVTPAPTLAVPTAEATVPSPTAAFVTPMSTATPERLPLDLPESSPRLASQASPLLVSAVPVLLLLAGVIAWTRGRSR